MSQTFVDRPEGNLFGVEQAMPRIEQHDPQRFPRQILQERAHESVNFLRRSQRLALRRLPRQPLAHFERRRHFARLGQAHALGQFAQFLHRHRRHPRQRSARRLDHLLPDIDRRAPRCSGAQKNGQQLRIAQRIRPAMHQFLARPLLLRPILDFRRRHAGSISIAPRRAPASHPAPLPNVASASPPTNQTILYPQASPATRLINACKYSATPRKPDVNRLSSKASNPCSASSTNCAAAAAVCCSAPRSASMVTICSASTSSPPNNNALTFS